MAVILGAAEMLAEPDLPAEMADQRIHAIRRHAARMGHILDAMLLLGRESLPAAGLSCNIADVLDDVLVDCKPLLLGRPIEMTLEVVAKPMLDAERALVYVLLSNLLRNACSHTREGQIHVVLSASTLEVRNTAEGSAQGRPILMKRYAKSHDSTGYGLGLSIVGRVCERLGWSMTVNQRSAGEVVASLVWPEG